MWVDHGSNLAFFFPTSFSRLRLPPLLFHIMDSQSPPLTAATGRYQGWPCRLVSHSPRQAESPRQAGVFKPPRQAGAFSPRQAGTSHSPRQAGLSHSFSQAGPSHFYPECRGGIFGLHAPRCHINVIRMKVSRPCAVSCRWITHHFDESVG